MKKSIGVEYAEGLSEPKETFSVSEKMCKGIKEMKIGDECTICCTGKITRIEKSEWTNEKVRASVEITKMEIEEEE
jgi:hypothetical protein